MQMQHERNSVPTAWLAAEQNKNKDRENERMQKTSLNEKSGRRRRNKERRFTYNGFRVRLSSFCIGL